jgi:hypothetical protein
MATSMLDRITDPQKIRETLDKHMMEPEKQRAPFLVTIFSREHRPGGIIYEGHRPIAACQTPNVRSYTLATSGSNYQRGCAFLKLSGIEYIEVLR